MVDITIHMRDGTKKEFKHAGRSGGSYTKTVRYEGGMTIVTDEWYNETAIPNDLIDRVETSGNERW